MADKKISALTAATTPLAGTEVLPIVQGGATVKVSVDNLTTGKPVSMSNLTYTGTVTGSTGIINIGSGQVYKDAAGNVGIGNLSPAVKLDVVRAGIGSIASFGANGVAGLLTLEYDGSQSVIKGSAFGAMSVRGGAGQGITLYTNATDNSVAINTAGNVTLNTGNLVIGTAGKGIDFSADPSAAGMTSELLDDYEEGGWIPTGNGITYSFATGTYIKIGNIVTVFYNVTFPTTSDTNQARLGGLPFVSSNTTTVAAVGLTGLSLTVDGNTFARFVGPSAYASNADLSTLSIIGQISYLA